jgi:sulfur-carrier protein
MKVKLKLFATLREGREKIIDLDLSEGTVIEQVLKRYDIEKSEIAICLINGRDAEFDRELADGDTLSLFPPVGGG